MLIPTKVLMLLGGASTAAAIGVGPVVHSDPALVGVVTAGALTAGVGAYRALRGRPVKH